MSENINRFALYQDSGTCWYFASLNGFLVSPYTRKFLRWDLDKYLKTLNISERSEIEKNFVPNACTRDPSRRVFYRFLWTILHPARTVQTVFTPNSKVATKSLLKAHHNANLNLSIPQSGGEQLIKFINKTRFIKGITKILDRYDKRVVDSNPITIIKDPASLPLDKLRFMNVVLTRGSGNHRPEHSVHMVTVVLLNGVTYMIDSNGFKSRCDINNLFTSTYNEFCMKTYGFVFSKSLVIFSVYTQNEVPQNHTQIIRKNPKNVHKKINYIGLASQVSKKAREALLKKRRNRPGIAAKNKAATKIQTFVRRRQLTTNLTNIFKRLRI
jgi:hypothetical protein